MQDEQTVLPVSGLQVQWRSRDDHFRICPPDAEGPAVERSPWRPWSGNSDMAVAISGPIDGNPTQMWWVVWGEYVGDDVVVTLDDLSHPAVVVVGKLWVTEWCGPRHEVIVVTGGQQAEIQFAAPLRQQAMRANAWRWRSIETPIGFHQVSGLRVR